jgi:NTP pyrophosphatase (non-canonical NTP hydrolase)
MITETNFDGLADELHATAVEKGFWRGDIGVDFILSKLALVHSEVSEVLEAVRKEKGDQQVVEEMADIIIRLLDLYSGMKENGWLQDGVSLDQVLDQKARFNTSRPRMHGVLA